jgi:hypothetical protein
MIDNISEMLQITTPMIVSKPAHYPCKMKYFLVQVKDVNLLFLSFSYLVLSLNFIIWLYEISYEKLHK